MSPTKSYRSLAPNFETEKRATQRQTKRQSLPSDWIGVCPSASAISLTNRTNAGDSPKSIIAAPAEETKQEALYGIVACTASPKRESQVQKQSPQLRMKTSSYMSPTTSTTRRAIATLGKIIRPSESKAKLRKLDLNIDFGTSHELESSPETVDIHLAKSPSPVYERTTALGRAEYPPQSQQPAHKEDAILPTKKDSATGQDSVFSPTDGHDAVIDKRSPSGGLIGYAAEQSPSELCAVRNTTAMRRTSHANILQPIYDKLDTHGLLKYNPISADLSSEVATAQKAVATGIAASQSITADANEAGSGGRITRALTDVAHFAWQGMGGGASPSLAQVAGEQTGKLNAPLPSLQAMTLEPTALGIDQNESSQTGTLDSKSRRSSALAAKTTPHFSLRATAESFEPIWKATTAPQELSMHEWQGTLAEYTPEQWSAMPAQVRQSIQVLRDFKRAGTQSPHRSASPSKRSAMRWWGALMRDEAATASAASSPNLSVASGSTIPASPDTMHDSAPATASVTENVPERVTTAVEQQQQAAIETVSETALPSDLLHEQPPPISPSSDDTSPLKAPHGARAWTIGSNYHPFMHSYGWKGGDGQEISFSGYGPQAEINLKNPVNMLFYPQGRSAASGKSRKSGDNVSPLPKVWPRSQKQWAALATAGKAPCGNMDILSATEHRPLGTEILGYCNDCVPT
jgi:hypothetical protein